MIGDNRPDASQRPALTGKAPGPVPVCAHCLAPDPIRGDGEMSFVCPRCLLALGRIAAEPFTVPRTVRERLLARSEDVLDLVGGEWRWTEWWPGVSR